MIEYLIKLALGSLSIAGVIIYLGKLILNRGADLIVESQKNKLELLRIEHQIKFSKLHEERGKLLS